MKTVTSNENTVSNAKRTRVLLPKLYKPHEECRGGTLIIFIRLSFWIGKQLCIPEHSSQVVAPFGHRYFFFIGNENVDRGGDKTTSL